MGHVALRATFCSFEKGLLTVRLAPSASCHSRPDLSPESGDEEGKSGWKGRWIYRCRKLHVERPHQFWVHAIRTCTATANLTPELDSAKMS
jgi:hypothetical protein